MTTSSSGKCFEPDFQIPEYDFVISLFKFSNRDDYDRICNVFTLSAAIIVICFPKIIVNTCNHALYLWYLDYSYLISLDY